jgi:hypothetical protein
MAWRGSLLFQTPTDKIQRLALMRSSDGVRFAWEEVVQLPADRGIRVARKPKRNGVVKAERIRLVECGSKN